MKTRRRNYTEGETRQVIFETQASANQIENPEPIPLDLIIEILSRLPAKSIAKCRCVSKPWASMLRRQDFTKLHLTRSSTRPHLLFVFQRDYSGLFFLSTPQDENSSLVAATYHMKLSVDDGGDSEICRSLSGLSLACLRLVSKGRSGTALAICNPSTGESLSLPKAKTRRVHVHSFIGYDPIEKQLKVLAMTWITKHAIRISEQHQVLTLGAKKMSWRMVECSIPHYHLSSGICINGILYYLAAFDTEIVVVSFDFRSEKFGLVEKCKDAVTLSDSALVNYKGKLGVITANGYQGVTRYTSSFEMCVLEDPEKQEWSKNVYEMPSIWENLVADDELHFVGMTGTNEILLSPEYPFDPFYVFYYNIESKTIRRVEIQGMDKDMFKNCKVHTSVNHVENVNLLHMS